MKVRRAAFEMASPVVVALAVAFATTSLLACDFDVEVPPFPDGQGQKKTFGAYPSGPFGVTAGTVITNFSFQGFFDPTVARDPTALGTISLSDFYNPTGDQTYPANSPYGEGIAKPKALLIDIGAVWCGPCQHEAQAILPGEYAKYHPKGAEFLFNLADGATVGVAPSAQQLAVWVEKYGTNYPAGIDPDRKLGAAFASGAYPINILLDTRSMKIVQVSQGVPDEDGPFFDALAQLLAE